MHVINEIKITDISRQFFDSASSLIQNYSVALIKVVTRGDFEDGVLIGSGTLVDISNTLGVLTANHVIEALPNDGEIGFVISKQLHKFTLNARHLTKLTIAKGTTPSEGPDIGFIALPRETIGQMKALKSFYNLALRRERLAQAVLEIDRGVWCICGFPDVETRDLGRLRGFDSVRAFFCLCGYGGVRNSRQIGGFDYFDFDVSYNDQIQPPSSFGGVSGGGLWQVIIGQNEHGEIEPKETLLSGVAFYQSAIRDNVRTLICHGRNSVYSNVFDVVVNRFS